MFGCACDRHFLLLLQCDPACYMTAHMHSLSLSHAYLPPTHTLDAHLRTCEQVPTATVLKNLSNLFTIVGDYYLYNKVYNKGVWAALGLMGLSALCAGFTDLSFSLSG